MDLATFRQFSLRALPLVGQQGVQPTRQTSAKLQHNEKVRAAERENVVCAEGREERARQAGREAKGRQEDARKRCASS